jgi:hypothetical protein
MQTNRFLTGVFETGYQLTAHDRECATNSAGRGSGRESETEVVSVNELLMQSLFSNEG